MWHLLGCSLHHVDDERNDEPLPEVGSVEHQQHPERHVQQVRPVEDLEAAAAPHKRLRAQKHHDEHAEERDARRIGAAAAQPEQSRPRGQQPFGQRVVAAVQYRIVRHDHREIDHVHDGVHHAVDGNQNAGHFVHVNVIVQRQDSAEAARSQECYALAQHQHQNKGTIEIQALT